MSDNPNKPAERMYSPRSADCAGDWDYIVIGSGMGGMTAAAMLARIGRRVLILERHYVPGGFTHTFRRKHYKWDVGVHAVGEVTEKSLIGRVLKDLTGGRLRWASLGKVYEQFYYPDGFRIDFPDNPRDFRQNLIDAFPAEEAAIDLYLRSVGEVAASMRNYFLSRTLPKRRAWLGRFLYPNKAGQHLGMLTEERIRELTDDERLQCVLTAQWGYYGSPPGRSSFAIQAMVARHFSHGGFYPVGGSERIAEEMLRTVSDAGGHTRTKADIKEIIIERGRAVGVGLNNGEKLSAKRIISAAGAMNTVRHMLPEGYDGGEWARSIADLNPAPCHVCLYIGFKGDITKAGASGANKWFINQWTMNYDAWNVAESGEPSPASVLYCSFPSLKDPLHDPGPDERHTGEVVTFVPWKSFERWKDTKWGKRGEDYNAFKSAMEKQLLAQLLGHMPELEPMVDYVELSTPLSTDHFVKPVMGSIYGIEPTPERFANEWLRPATPVRGLYLAGSEVASVGVIGAMMGGILAVAAAEPLKGGRYFKGFMGNRGGR